MTLDDMLDLIVDPLALARRRTDRCLMASSYDRRGGNHDWSNYLRVVGSQAVLMDAAGPGCITRIWTADPQHGTVRVYIDGVEVKDLTGPFRGLFAKLPLWFGIGGEGAENYARSKAEGLPMGHTSYCPIPFARSCKVTIDPEDDYLYYQVNYRLFAAGTEVETFVPNRDLPLVRASSAQASFDAMLSGAPASAWADAASRTVSLTPGEDVELLHAEGPGAVTGLCIRLPNLADAATRAHVRDNLWLTVHADDDEPRDPSVRAPIGPFFLDFGQTPTPRSFHVGTDVDSRYYCLFAMPHRERVTIRLQNRSIIPLPSIEVTPHHEAWETFDDDLQRFRATWHCETPFGPDHRDYGGAAVRILNLDGRDNYEMLNARAAGHFVGCGFHIDLRDAPTDRAAGEGDEMFFIDDEPRLTLYGTGTEDYVNDAWGLRGYVGPYSGDAIHGGWSVDPQLFGYRLHLSDCVPFVRKGRFTLEHGTGNNCSGAYRSVAYWYMDPASARTRVEERRWEEIRNRG